jgi:hypothetical protein
LICRVFSFVSLCAPDARRCAAVNRRRSDRSSSINCCLGLRASDFSVCCDLGIRPPLTLGPDLTQHLSRTQQFDQATCYSGIVRLNDLTCSRRKTLLSIHSNTSQYVQSHHTRRWNQIETGAMQSVVVNSFRTCSTIQCFSGGFSKNLLRQLHDRINTRCWHRSENRDSAETIRSTMKGTS